MKFPDIPCRSHQWLTCGPQLQDHLALAGTCRRIRAAYTDNVWNVSRSGLNIGTALHGSRQALVRPFPRSSYRNSARHIFSNALAHALKLQGRSIQTLDSDIRAEVCIIRGWSYFAVHHGTFQIAVDVNWARITTVGPHVHYPL